MKTVVAFLLLLSLAPLSASSAQPDLDGLIEAKMRAHLIPGAAVVVVREGRVAYRKGFGALTPSEPIVIGSLSKAFTATAILQLVEAGKIDLDAPVRTYLPQFRMADPAAGAITIRQLLHHTSGIPTGASRAAGDAPLSEHVEALASAGLAARPGERHIYASPNYQVLGRVVEVVSGESFGRYVERHIFAPLGMSGSATDARRMPVARGHNVWWGFAGPSTYRWEPGRLPTASLIVSADDMARFALAHLGRSATPVLSSRSLATAHRGGAKTEYYSYAMGWRDGTTAGVPSLWHGGALPSYRAAAVLIPRSQSAVIVFTNASTMFADHTREIAAAIVATLEGGPQPQGFRPLRQTYLVIAAVCALLVILQVRSLLRARSSRKSAGATVAFDLILPIAAVVAVPLYLNLSWRAILDAAPDIAVTTALLVVLSVTTGILRLAARRSPSAAEQGKGRPAPQGGAG